MTATRTWSDRLGFAVGVALVSVATLGVFWHFWRPEASAWLWGGGSFVLGGALGALIHSLQTRRA